MSFNAINILCGKMVCFINFYIFFFASTNWWRRSWNILLNIAIGHNWIQYGAGTGIMAMPLHQPFKSTRAYYKFWVKKTHSARLVSVFLVRHKNETDAYTFCVCLVNDSWSPFLSLAPPHTFPVSHLFIGVDDIWNNPAGDV